MAPLLRIRRLDLHERPVPFARPFRFGVVSVDQASLAMVRVEIELADGRRAHGGGAELMAPKWFNKDPALSSAATVDQLRAALHAARNLYLDGGSDTAFGLHAERLAAVTAACASLPALAAAFGPALIDKAVVDALARALGISVFALLRENAIGLDARLTPDIAAPAITRFLESRRPSMQVAVRHTVGLLDDPASLAGELGATGCRYLKLKLCGEPQADRLRLGALAQALQSTMPVSGITLDANEQYPDAMALQALVTAVGADPALRFIADRLLYIEQPLPREITRSQPLGALGRHVPVVIDEADDCYGAFPAALAQGYRGCSSKSCKGIYKSLLNGARCAALSALGTACMMTAEDLTCIAGLPVQQDTALVAFHGIAHAERNGHHYAPGFPGAPAAEAARFLAAHPDLYMPGADGPVLRIADGMLATGSLHVPGFASGAMPDWRTLAPLATPQPPESRL